MVDLDRTLWLGFVLETDGGNVYYAGDTAFGPHFLRIRERFGRPRLAILPIGAYEPVALRAVHISPEEAVHAHRILGAGTSIAVHWGTFVQGAEAQEEPPAALRDALRWDEAEHFLIPDHGIGVHVPR